MPLKQQKSATGYVPRQQLGLLELKLGQAGYEIHPGPAAPRNGEIAKFRRVFAGGQRQNHVQLVARGSVIAVYAHTEPCTERVFAHALSAFFDGASFSGGSKMLLNDLARVGFELYTFAGASAAAY